MSAIAKQILLRMRANGFPGCYVLGCCNDRVTFYSQQKRACNLVWALFEQGEFAAKQSDTNPKTAAVVGGGLGGLTAAAMLAMRGVNVTLYEKAADILHLQSGSRTRHVHPNLFDWPAPDATSDRTELPFLNWRANTAHEIVHSLRQQWDRVAKAGAVDVRLRHRGATIDTRDGKPVLHVDAGGMVDSAYDVIVLAVGFGIERELQGFPHLSYWRNDSFEQTELTTRESQRVKKFLVIGCGDGGIIDVIRLRLRNFDQGRMVPELYADQSCQPLLTRLREIENEVLVKLETKLAGDDLSSFIKGEYDKIPFPQMAPGLLDAITQRLRDDTSVTLVSRNAVPVNPSASLLNRFTGYLLHRIGKVEYYRGSVSSAAAGGPPYAVTIQSPDAKEAAYYFDEVVVRLGPEPSIRGILPEPLVAQIRKSNASPPDITREIQWAPGDFICPWLAPPDLITAQERLADAVVALFDTAHVSEVGLSRDQNGRIAYVVRSPFTPETFPGKKHDSIFGVPIRYEQILSDHLPQQLRMTPSERLRMGDAVTNIDANQRRKRKSNKPTKNPKPKPAVRLESFTSEDEGAFPELPAGTSSVGAFVELKSGGMGLLTTAHGITWQVDGRPGDRLAVIRDGHTYGPVVAILTRASPLTVPPRDPNARVRYDAAVAVLADGVEFSRDPALDMDPGPAIRGLGEPALGDVVCKIGAATGLTWGTIDRIELTGQGRDIPFVEGAFTVAGNDGAFSRPGDSGALVVRQDGRALGLVFGAVHGATYAFPLRECLADLECSLLYSPHRVQPAQGQSMAKHKKDTGKKKPTASVPVDAHKHPTDTRPNIPTRETSAFATDDGPQKFVANRDRSLDPQLVWKGKDEQDSRPLEIPVVPIHVQEKIQPQAIIEAVKGWAKRGKPVYDLFADFNGLDDFSKRLEFYQHDQHWTNRLILGDSLLVMASLAEKERLRGKVQCVYFDPPYGIKFGSNWQVSTRKRDVKDAKADDLTRQPEQIKAFRDTWELGIHSYLSYMRDRLVAARDLLTESGSIFVQIGDANVHLVRSLMDEVFGSENFVAILPFAKTTSSTREYIGGTCDFLLFYAKCKEHLKYRQLFTSKSVESEVGGPYSLVELPDGTRRRMIPEERVNTKAIPKNARVYRIDNLQSQSMGREKGEGASCWFPVKFAGKDWRPGEQSRWKTNEKGMDCLLAARRLESTGTGLYYVRYIDDFPAMPLADNWSDTVVAGFASDKKYVVETSTKVVERCVLMATDPGDLVLDPTCGSGTTAYVAEQWGRRWITTDTSRVALALARTRLMAARFPYYLLADSPEGRKKQTALTGIPPDPSAPPTKGDMHRGFVYKQVPHVTLKSIANNPDIKEGMTREQIDAAIKKHADTETLYDQPHEDKDIVRLTGPFTVESLSPHRALPTVEATSVADAPGSPTPTATFGQMILDNLRKAGVKGTDKSQRITFTRLDPFPGELIQAEGETDTGAAVRVCIGPEFGTLGDADIKKAALEAIKGSKCDLLLVCAFAFEPSVHEQTAELTKEIKLGKLAVLPVRMNPDLAMGDELLKKTGAGNLFTVFGEPDLKLDVKNGQVVVTIRGVDVFDPSTGAVRTGDTDDIACWFIDTDYDGQSFFVRHAYFLYGGKDTKEGPYEKLKKALRAEIDEAEWSKLYSATSQPFDLPKTGKIAVKVINHFGDEVLKVYPIRTKTAAPGKGK